MTEGPPDLAALLDEVTRPRGHLPKSRDFVPEPWPRPGQYLPATQEVLRALRAAPGREQVILECPVCGRLADEDFGPDICPDCESYMSALPDAAWDDPE